MGKLTFVGLGLGSKGTSLEGVMVIKAADHAYLEYYTSPHEATLLEELERASGKKMSVVDRVFVEDGARLLEQAKTLDVVLCVQGDPMLATTHTELRVRAIKAGIQTRIIHGASILSAAVSVSGLHVYKFGKTITFPREAASRNETYRTVHRNLVQGLHTLLLMEFDVEKNEGVTPVEIF